MVQKFRVGKLSVKTSGPKLIGIEGTAFLMKYKLTEGELISKTQGWGLPSPSLTEENKFPWKNEKLEAEK